MANILLATDWGLFFIGCISVDDYWNELYDLLINLIAVYVPDISDCQNFLIMASKVHFYHGLRTS